MSPAQTPVAKEWFIEGMVFLGFAGGRNPVPVTCACYSWENSSINKCKNIYLLLNIGTYTYIYIHLCIYIWFKGALPFPRGSSFLVLSMFNFFGCDPDRFGKLFD